MRIGTGIDTGGTYTDAVIYDFESRRILGSAKALTTREDLSAGILAAMDRLPAELLRLSEMISLSTTLATNACVEDKCGRAKLVFFGGESAVIEKYGSEYGLPAPEDMLIYERGTDKDGEPDWKLFKEYVRNGFKGLDGVGIVEMDAMRNGAEIEKKAKEIFRGLQTVPIVCGSELSGGLNSLRRAAGTLLNAELFPVISEFMSAIKKALSARGINAPIVIVRSDGTLMPETFAASHPVETLLCGPAASALAGSRLAGRDNCIIIDMGGTTTDIAVVRGGAPVMANSGVSVGSWSTFVSGLYIRTVGLGGDSAVHYEGDRLFLEEYRVVPLCTAADSHPEILDSLRSIAANKRRHTRFLYEHFLLAAPGYDKARYTDKEIAFCEALRRGPLSIAAAAEAVNSDIYSLKTERLIKEGVVHLCGLTPTDIMHITGDFTDFNTEAAELGAEFAAFNLGISVSELCKRVYHEVKRKLYMNIAEVMLENTYPRFMKNGVPSEVLRFLEENMQAGGGGDGLMSLTFATGYALVGTGAPVKAFLGDVADMLGTECVIPEHYKVANALGAVMGSIGAQSTSEIRPDCDDEGVTGFIVYSESGKRFFEDYGEAEEYAVSEAKRAACTEARERGAIGEIEVACTVERNDADARDCQIYFGTTVTARATGSRGL